MSAVNRSPFLSSDQIKPHCEALAQAGNKVLNSFVYIQSYAQAEQPSYRQTELVQLSKRIKLFERRDVQDALHRLSEEKSNLNDVFIALSLENLHVNKQVILLQKQRTEDWLKIVYTPPAGPNPENSSPHARAIKSTGANQVDIESQIGIVKKTSWFARLVIGALIGGLGSRFAGFHKGAILASSIAGAILGTFLFEPHPK